MKIFNIKVVKKRVFNILADTFPKLSTLLFNVYYNYSIVVTKIIQKMKSFTTLKMTQAFILNQSFLKVTQKCSSNIKAGTLKITYTFKSRIKESVNFVQNLSINAIAKMRVKASLTLTTTFDMVTDALVGKFRLLGELDPYYLVTQLKYNTFVNNGKTTQGGTGDPSPTNIRPIYGVGQFDGKTVLNGQQPTLQYNTAINAALIGGYSDVAPPSNNNVIAVMLSSYLPVKSASAVNGGEYGIGINTTGVIYLRIDGLKSTDEYNQYLAAHPLTLWYKSTAYAAATQVYIGFSVTDANGYHGYAAGPMAPLYDGDTLDFMSGEVVRNKKEIIFDGISDGKKVESAGVAYLHVSPNTKDCSSQVILTVCSHYSSIVFGVTAASSIFFRNNGSGNGITPQYASASDFNAYLSSQYTSGTPVTIVYPLATPTTETVPISEPIANTTGQTTIVVENTYTTTTTPINGLDDLTLGELDFQSVNI